MDVVSDIDFLSAEPVEGELLAERLAGGPLAPEEALGIAIDVGRILSKAHLAEKVHGCLSVEHVLIASDGTHVLRPRPGTASAARYRAPEQVRGEAPDTRSDIFAYGALLYEMVTGRAAFRETGPELDEAILYEPPAAISGRSSILAGMEGVIAGCLEKDPSRRRQRIQNAVIELRLAGRWLPSMAAAMRALPGRGRPAPPILAAIPPPAPLPEPEKAASPPASAFLDGEPGGNANRPEPWTPSARDVSRGFRRRFTVIALATVALAATGLAAVMYLHQRPTGPAVNFSVAAPEHTSYPGTPAVSPDGRYLAFSAVGPEGQRMLWLRALDEMHAQLIAGTEGGFAPFWSPDSEDLGFFANRMLKKVRVRNDGLDPRPQMLATTELEAGGGTWNADGTILFAPGMNDGLYRVPASGGQPVLVLRPDAALREHALLWPQFLPDGKHFIYFSQTGYAETSGLWAGGIEDGVRRKLFASETNAVYSTDGHSASSGTGYLLYMHGRDLMRQGFHTGKLTLDGDPAVVAPDIGSLRSLALAPISVSTNGVLVYQTMGQALRQLAWMDRTGRQIGTVGESGEWGPPRISPDGARVAVGKRSTDGVNADLWIFDAKGNATQFVYANGISEGSPVWSPDGSRIAYWSNSDGPYDLFVKNIATGRTELLLKNTNNKVPSDWSRDGRYLLFHSTVPGTQSDVWAMSLADRKSGPIVDTIRREEFGTLSPDGKWLAYQSDEGERFAVYVQPFDGITQGTKRTWRISPDGLDVQASLPRWRSDGQELFFITMDGTMMSTSVSPKNGELAFTAPKALFHTRPIPGTWNVYDVSPDGERFLVNLPLEWSNSSVITVMTNWTEKLQK